MQESTYLTYMKKIITLVISSLLPIFAWSQAQINTKKVKISDFTQKITKVVLSGNAFQDSVLQNGVAMCWRISPYEFCSMEDFNDLKGSEDYYFLLSVNGQFKNDSKPTIHYLTLVKGGKGADEGVGEMLEVVSIPVTSAESPSGRETVFMQALLEIIQNYTLASMEKDAVGYGGLESFVEKVGKNDEISVVFSENDLDSSARKAASALALETGVSIVSEEEADKYMNDGKEGFALSYVVAPSEPMPGAVCYRMLIDAYTHQLYYYSKGKVSKKEGAGFSAGEVRKVSSIISKQ